MERAINIVRSKRKSICISVSFENIITVRCPLRMPESKIYEFIESKKVWLDNVTARNAVNLIENKDITEYKKIYVYGVSLPLIISDKNEITSQAVFVKSLKNIKNTYCSRFSDDFIAKVIDLSRLLNLRVSNVSIRYYKRRWGCCDRKCGVTFNYLLFMLPEDLQRYVVVHELCHTVYFNHSAEFWRLVQKIEPDYRELKRRLKSFDFITNLY